MNAVISLRFRPRPVPPDVGLCWRATARGTLIGANLPELGLIGRFSRWLTQVALKGCDGGVQCLQAGFGAIALMSAATIKRSRRQTPVFTRPPAGRVTEMVRDERLS